MLRSLYSAVSGMKAHQTKLDVIGNNIANVNTYGFKSSRARFQDVFYQTLQSAAGGDNNKGGTNASQVGYGSQLGGIDLDMSRSALQSTGRPLDVAITGEGFFQVMDADGNIFYTRAGNLMLDSNSGNLVDSNGYTVLGVSGDPLGKAPSSDKIHLNIPTKSSGLASKTLTINGTQFTITSEKATTDANVSITFKAEDNLPSGSDIVVNPSDINDSSITVHVNKNAIFTSLSDFNSKMNSAIIENADYADSRICVFLTVGVSYESDLKKAKELLAAEVAQQPTYLDVRTEQQKHDGAPKVTVVVLELADSSVTLRASLWAKDNATAFALKCAVLEDIKQTYDREGIEIAYPHMQVVSSSPSAEG